MKKFVLLVSTIAVLIAMSVTAFAATTVTLTLSSETVDVAAGTQDVTLTAVYTFSSETEVSAMALDFVLPDGVTLKEYNTDSFAAFCDDLFDDSNGSTITIMDDDMSCMINGTVSIPVTFTIDTSVAKVYNIELSEDSYMADADGEPLNDVSANPTATITVETAGPVATEKTVEKAVSVNANDIEIDGVTYQNVAVLDGTFTLPTLETGESLTAAGIKYDGTSVKTFTGLTGGGEITYRALFYGITDDEANALGAKVKSYYTGMFFED